METLGYQNFEEVRCASCAFNEWSAEDDSVDPPKGYHTIIGEQFQENVQCDNCEVWF